MDLSRHFQFQPKTIQLELSGGGAHGAYECGALEVLLPFWQTRGFKVDVVTGVSAGAVNAVLLSAALNSGQDISLMSSFWDKLAKKGDTYLGPLLEWHALTNSFNFFARPSDQFPNIPSRWMSMMQLGGKSAVPLHQLKELLQDHIGESGWDAVRSGSTETYVGALEVLPNGERKPVLFTGQELNPQTILASAALRDFAAYKIGDRHYEDGGYDKIGFFLKDHKTDVLFTIGLKPLRNASELQDHRGVKTGQLHHDLTRYAIDPERQCTIDFICLNPPEYWNETSAMNNTSRNIDILRAMGRTDALKWIERYGNSLGVTDSFIPSPDVLKLMEPALKAA